MAKRRPAATQHQARKRHERRAFRDEILALHRTIFRRNQERIRELSGGQSPAFRRYERAYTRVVQRFERRATWAELDRALARAAVVYVGDYHTLARAQRTFAQLLERLPAERPVIVALEFIASRHQRLVEAYQQGLMTEEEFLRRSKFAGEWGSAAWPQCRAILELARQRGYRVIGIDSRRSPVFGAATSGGGNLRARDQHAAHVLARAHQSHPQALLMVLIGDLHIAPDNLPKQVQKLFGGISTAPRPLWVFQNCEQLYWQLAARGVEHEVDLVRVAPQQYCIFNTPPILCQLSFLNWLDAADDTGELEAPEALFREYAQMIAQFFGLDVGDSLDEVHVTTLADLNFLQGLKRRRDFSAAQFAFVRHQVVHSESCYIPRAKIVYLGNVLTNHISEEATHFLRHVTSGDEHPPTRLVDGFYARCLEEALGFLGSKIINHRRQCPDEKFFQHQLRSTRSAPFDRMLARLVLKHGRLEEGRPVRSLGVIYRSGPRMFDAVAHAVGYRLGNKLYYALKAGDIAKHEVRALFYTSFLPPGVALSHFLFLNARAVHITVPDLFG